jgi:flagellar hook-associated protein 3 FlgL
MKSTFISTRAISEATRLSMLKMQAKLLVAEKEVATGRLADVGKSLGHQAGQTVSLRQEHVRLSTIIDSNTEVATRLDLTQASIKQVLDGAQAFLGQLIGSRNSETGPGVIKGQAEGAQEALIDTLNAAFNGLHLFAGINTDVKPVASYDQSPPGANKQSVATAFQAAFGVTQQDPGVNSIAPASMQAFLDGAFADLFDETTWAANWSSAADQNLRSRISTSELVETSMNANELGVRKLASVYTMLADLGVENLNKQTFQTVVDTAIRLTGEGIQEMAKLQANLGIAQERVEVANQRMSLQIDIITTHIGALESVDPYEAQTRLAALTTQIETSYALTARIQRLSLLNYL